MGYVHAILTNLNVAMEYVISLVEANFSSNVFNQVYLLHNYILINSYYE